MGEECIRLSAFGAQASVRRNLSVATIQVVARSDVQIPINVLVDDQIPAPPSRPNSSLAITYTAFPHLQGPQPVTSDDSFEISPLIRSDGPTAMQSKLDYLISGPLQSASLLEPSVTLLHVTVAPQEEEFDMERV